MSEEIIKEKYEVCEVCGCKSRVYKKVKSATYSATHLVCPREEKYPDLHEELEGKLESLEGNHPKSYIKELEEEIGVLKKKFTDISPKDN